MTSQQLIVTCPKGFEPLLFQEIQSILGAHIFCKEQIAAVIVNAGIQEAYRIILWSRLANRVLWQLIEAPCDTAGDLYKITRAIDWQTHFHCHNTFCIDFSGTTEALNHTEFNAQKTKDAIVDYFRDKVGVRPSVNTENPDIRLNARLHKNQLTLSLDLSGKSLHERGYRAEQGAASLKENLASAILMRLGLPQKPYLAIIDPVCGSGTFLIEAYHMLADIAPALSRTHFGFLRWKKHNAELWEKIVNEAEVRKIAGLNKNLPPIKGYDADKFLIQKARANIERAGLSEKISCKVASLSELCNEEKLSQGLLVANPPYGERLQVDDIASIYQTLAKQYRDHFQGWRLGIFTGAPEHCKQIGLKPAKKYRFFNGALPCELLIYDGKLPVNTKVETGCELPLPDPQRD
jgi:23S rRNA (guanine2445-N2)-methyltransferase / 23S rRNA (guanine2069-N7)-methyltransferase